MITPDKRSTQSQEGTRQQSQDRKTEFQSKGDHSGQNIRCNPFGDFPVEHLSIFPEATIPCYPSVLHYPPFPHVHQTTAIIPTRFLSIFSIVQTNYQGHPAKLRRLKPVIFSSNRRSLPGIVMQSLAERENSSLPAGGEDPEPL